MRKRKTGIDHAEIKEGGVWSTIYLDEALKRRGEPMRCPECYGPIAPHKKSSVSLTGHFEHATRHAGCSLIRQSFDNTRRKHPDALE